MAVGFAGLLLRLPLLVAVAPLASCLYEDQIGKFDWRQQHIGLISHAVFDSTSAKVKQVIVSTDENVLAALTVSGGHIAWRRLLEKTEQPAELYALSDSSDVLTISSGHIRRWTAQGGYVVWERALAARPSAQQQQSSATGRLPAAVHNQGIVVADGHSVVVFDVKTGADTQSHSLPALRDAGAVYHASDEESMYVITVIPEQYVQVHTIKDEVLSKTPRTISGTWLTDGKQCTVAGLSLVCYDSSSRSLRALDIVQGSSFGAPVLAPFAVAKLRQLRAGLSYVIADADGPSVEDGGVSCVLYEVLPGSEGLRSIAAVQGRVAIVEGAEENNKLFAVVSVSDKSVLLSGYSLETGQEIADYKHQFSTLSSSPVAEAFVNFIRKRDGSAAFRVLTVSADHAVAMFQSPGGEPSWTREEALAKVVAAEMVDLPVSSIQAKMEEEFDHANEANPLSAFVRRVTSQVAQLWVYAARESSRAVHTAAALYGLSTGESQRKAPAIRPSYGGDGVPSSDDDEYLTRDTFNLHKMLVLVSAPGKVFGMDSYTGRVAWRWSLPPFVRPLADGHYVLFTQRTAAHVPLRPVCTVIGRHSETNKAVAVSFDPITGKAELQATGSDLGFQLLQVALLPGLDRDFMRPIVLLDTERQIHFYPKPRLTLPAMKSMFLYTASEESGRLDGYFVKDLHADRPAADGTWTVRTGTGNQRILAVAMKKPTEHIHSLGKVLADRSVLYKYSNPNLIAVAAEGDDKKTSKFISIYLIDGVTGKVVFHCEHKRANGPVHMVHSENWVVYTYYNEKSRREEIAVLELFEGTAQANATAFSSFAAANVNPVVMKQAYVLGVPATTALAVTITEKGISSQNLLIARKTGGLFELPKVLLDPRRPLVPTAESRDEGVPPYLPELALNPESAINYNQSVFAVRNIHTSPAGLESTSLVLAYGLDMFFTRVAPSRMYDVLKDDFDFVFIGGVTAAMIVVSIVSKQFAHRRAVGKAWK